MNALLQKHGIETLDQLTPETLMAFLADCGLRYNDITSIEQVDTLLKRVAFACSCGYVTAFGDNKTGDRFFRIEGADRFVKVNPRSDWAEIVAREEAEKAQRKAEREAKKVLPAGARQPRYTSSGSCYYPYSRNVVEVNKSSIKAGDLLLLRYGYGTQLFKVTAVTGPVGLEGYRLENRGQIRFACWTKSRISRNDARILGLGFLSVGDPAYPA